ncbi:4'-phosphopantetheinyl transferase family protein [Amycolatopsis sp. lyj-108]|uniref:4'-phosphopantetheinyl transferase family protein n=1 Tax=Amycolatopsis sp. lyj-108 TaxID=2789286 RepID=UPI00397C8167
MTATSPAGAASPVTAPLPGALPPGACHVWWASTEQASDRHLALLDPVERARRAGIAGQADRDRFTVGCALLRLTAGGYTGVAPERVRITRSCPDCALPHGKPAVLDGDIEVSVSHSGRRIAVAVSSAGAVGVDVEEIRADADVRGMAAYVLSPVESARPATPGVDEFAAFYTSWTRKEAIVKATGDGLRTPLSSLTLSPPGEGVRLLAAEGRDGLRGQVTIKDLAAGHGYAAAVAVLGPRLLEVRELDGNALLACEDRNRVRTVDVLVGTDGRCRQ